MNQLEARFESLFFRGRWLLAPFFVGLLLAVIALLFKFFKELSHLFFELFTITSEDAIISILTLVDTSLLAGLLLIIAFGGYENFVSKFSIGDHEDRPAWMGKVGFSDLKLKLIGAIVAISAIELLKAFINPWQSNYEQLGWMIAIHLTFVASGVLFAITDYIVGLSNKH
ncbi:MAG: TIGR00645 family protein [Gammaproteobacteria bacterium]|nr:TIGR00645 family protein [Gammaproteobacteria bacterium]